MTNQPEGQTPRMADFLTIENANAEVDRLRLSIEGAGGWKDQCEERLQKIYAIQRENADLRQQLEAAKLGERFHDEQANKYAAQVAHWIAKHDAAEAAKLPETRDAEWRSHDNSGMRYPESSDTCGGETDAKLPQSHVKVPVKKCIYPDCNCPLDAPADPLWCARGLPQSASKVMRYAAAKLSSVVNAMPRYENQEIREFCIDEISKVAAMLRAAQEERK